MKYLNIYHQSNHNIVKLTSEPGWSPGLLAGFVTALLHNLRFLVVLGRGWLGWQL